MTRASATPPPRSRAGGTSTAGSTTSAAARARRRRFHASRRRREAASPAGGKRGSGGSAIAARTWRGFSLRTRAHPRRTTALRRRQPIEKTAFAEDPDCPPTSTIRVSSANLGCRRGEGSLPEDARGRALLGGRRPCAATACTDRVSPEAPLPPVEVARGERTPDRLTPDCPSIRRRDHASRREPSPARLREGNRRDLRHRERARRCKSANVLRRTSPELRSPATVGRTPVVADAGVQPLRRPGRRPRARRPGRPHVVAGRAWKRRRRPLRALAGPARSSVARQPRRARRRVRARARRRRAGDPRSRDRIPRRQQAATTEADSTAAVLRDHRDVRRFRA